MIEIQCLKYIIFNTAQQWKREGGSCTMALPWATVKWKFPIHFQNNNVCLFRLQRLKVSFITAQPGFYHCTNIVYHCPNGQWYPHILGTVKISFLQSIQWSNCALVVWLHQLQLECEVSRIGIRRSHLLLLLLILTGCCWYGFWQFNWSI